MSAPAKDGFCGPPDSAEEVTLASEFPVLGNQTTGAKINRPIV
jgi:hypothetical protein